MDVLLSFLLILVAAGLFLQKPLQVNLQVTHKYLQPEMTLVNTDADQKILDEQKAAVDQVAKAIQDMMGVNDDE